MQKSDPKILMMREIPKDLRGLSPLAGQQRRQPLPIKVRLEIAGFCPGRASLVFTNPTKFNLRTSQTETSKRFVQNAFLRQRQPLNAGGL
jgi:hypothetical protein